VIYVPERAWQWMRRIEWGEGRTVSLDWGVELWKWDVSRYESADRIRAALMRDGKLPADDDSILFEATRSLVHDVVDAAGGVEQAHQRLHRTMDDVRRVQAQYSASLGRSLEGMGVSDPTVEAAWYAIEELLVWARVLDDRLRRDAKRKGYPDQGLIPALADGLRRDAIIAARVRLCTVVYKRPATCPGSTSICSHHRLVPSTAGSRTVRYSYGSPTA
jgi:hypothetical protein